MDYMLLACSGTWISIPEVITCAPQGWKNDHLNNVGIKTEDRKEDRDISLSQEGETHLLGKVSLMIQKFIGLGGSIRFTGDFYALFALSSVVFFYGGFPFLKGIVEELRSKHSQE
jgi:cation transport ATPase